MKEAPRGFGRHGIVRGLGHVPSSPHFEGRFGRLFRHLRPAAHTEDELKKLGDAMTATPDPPDPETNNPGDDEENLGISAGYTYFGQFIDHDLTFDPSTLAQQKSDPDAIVDFRTPKFDLDNMYGRGPNDQPYLYDFQDDGSIKMLLGKKLTGNDNDPDTRDLPRTSAETGRRFALIGDKRNDENVIVSQLQGMFLRFHNRMVNYHRSKGLKTDFDTVRQAVQFHYQWVVLNDFLPTIIGVDMHKLIFPHIAEKTSILGNPPHRLFYDWRNEPFMPVEFSVAAYRFGHSMVRPLYRLNANTGKDAPAGTDPRLPIFPNLLAFGEFDNTFAIDWRLFFDFGNVHDQFSAQRIQPAYKPDTSLVNPLGNLPAPITGETPPSLAELNLRRGLKLLLPSGQSVAKAMGHVPIPDEKLLVGKANEDGMTPGTKDSNQPITKLSSNFAGNAPLWFYILAEAQQQFKTNATPIRLGPVGGRIVGEVFSGLLEGDSASLFSHPTWTPYADFLNGKKEFGIPELISQAMLSEK
jgi:Animal haem peroxidase